MIRNVNKIKKEIPSITIYNQNETNNSNFQEPKDIIIKLNNKGKEEYEELLFSYIKKKKLNIPEKDIIELLSNLKIVINIDSWIKCKGVFYIKSNINNSPVKMWYKLIPKGNVNSNPPEYKINLIEIKTCKEVPNTNQIYFNKKSEILYNQIYNYLKNELIILFKNIIYVIDE